MPRVLFITRKWPPAVGGMETYALELATQLAALCQLQVRALAGRRNGRPPGVLRLLQFVVVSMWMAYSSRADVIHLGDLVLWPLAVAARLGKSARRVVMTAYGLDLVYGRRCGVLPWIYARYLALGVKLVGSSTHVIAISSPTAALCREAGFVHVDVVKLGVQTPMSVSDSPPLASQPFVLFVGRLVRRKGAGWFAQEVLPLLPPSVRMVAVGTCWDEAELAVLRASGRIEYRDFVSREELLALRQSALVVIMPNIPTDGLDVEGFGLTALEAAADGGVLLASGIEGIVDAVIDGTTGFLLPAGSAEQWAAKIAEINAWSSAERAAFIEQAQHAVNTHFSWRGVAERTLSVYLAKV